MASAGQNTTAIVVLVHGSMHGGWCWKRVVPLLRAAGHEVFTPTLTGLGERAHLAHLGIDLDAHIQDVLGVLAKTSTMSCWLATAMPPWSSPEWRTAARSESRTSSTSMGHLRARAKHCSTSSHRTAKRPGGCRSRGTADGCPRPIRRW